MPMFRLCHCLGIMNNYSYSAPPTIANASIQQNRDTFSFDRDLLALESVLPPH